MVVVMQEGAKEEQIQHVIDRLVSMGFDIHRSTGASQTVLGAVGVPPDFDPRDVEVIDGVREVVRITQPYKLASRAFRPQGTVVELPRGVRIGGTEVVVAAGPCSVENPEQIGVIADRVAKAGAKILRGGAFKPRSSPYSFQGHGEKALDHDARGRGKERPARLQRSDGRVADSVDAALRGYFSGRRAQHAELFSAARARNGQQTRAAEAGHVRDD